MTDEEQERADRRLQRLSQQWAHQWQEVRAERERRLEPRPLTTGPSNFNRAQVPWGFDLAAAWSWRLLVIAAATYGLLWLLGFFAVVTIPLVVALLIAALAGPLVDRMDNVMPRAIAAMIVVILGIAFVATLLTFAGQQVATGAQDLADQVVKGLGQIKTWLKTGPLNASDSQINSYIEATQKAITDRSKNGEVVGQVTTVGTAIGHLVAGLFITLFATYFFLADGRRIWSWLVRLAPRAAREHLDGSGKVGWVSLTQFVRATVLVAAVDAIGIMIVAAVLRVPFIFAIGVLVFLGAFIPMVGATVAGTVAVLVALVDQGPFTALLMLGGVILVQQVEGHVLQPFLMGRFVSVHPLGVIVAIAMGVLVAGVAGALVAVPLAAVGNAVAQHLARHTDLGDDPVTELAEDFEEVDSDAPPVPPPADEVGEDEDSADLRGQQARHVEEEQ